MNIAVLGSLSACAPAGRDATLTGATMGTTYSIRVAQADLDRNELQVLQADIDAALDEVNRQMSTWRPDSEIAAFNRAGANEPLTVSAGFLAVTRLALAVAAATDGAFDPTVGVLVNLWGFGPDGRRLDRPAPEQIATARQQVGYRHVAITPDGRIAKDIPGLKLDLSAIAKGYGVDQVAELLQSRDIRNFFVEIGGETRAAGLNAQGEPWRVGVVRPDFSPEGTALQGIAHLTGGKAIATSGNYRNFFRDENGNVETHIIDPRTAEPVRHDLASVSVLANDCATADALATALFVLGPGAGQAVLDRAFPGVDALFILRRADGGFAETASPGFTNALSYERLAE